MSLLSCLCNDGINADKKQTRTPLQSEKGSDFVVVVKIMRIKLTTLRMEPYAIPNCALYRAYLNRDTLTWSRTVSRIWCNGIYEPNVLGKLQKIKY